MDKTTTISPLQVPAIAAGKALFSDAEPSRVRIWLSALPSANPGASGRELLEVLQATNRAPLNRMPRLAFAEALRRTVYETCEALALKYARKPLPLSEDEDALSQLVRQLYEELANAYKLALNQTAQRRRIGSGERKDLLLASQRSLLALGRELLESYRVYAPESPRLWPDLHQLYRNAEALRLQALPVEAMPDTEETSLSIKQAYLRAVILSLSNPYHLALGEAEELYRRIGRWVHFVRISIPESPRHQLGRFLVDLDSELPPRYAPRQQRQLPARNPRVLELDDLVRVLNEQVDRLNETISRQNSGHTFSERMQRDMYERFAHALGGRQERHSERTPNLAKLRMVDGLSGCHFMLNDGRDFAPEQDEQRWQDRVSMHDRNQGGLELHAGSDHSNGLSENQGRRSRFRAHDPDVDDVWNRAIRLQAEPAPELPGVAIHRAEVWSRKNQSDGGLALFCPSGCRTRTRVGEVVAWTESPLPQPPGTAWRLGVIRWLRTRPRGGIELGIQKLAETGYAAGCKAISGPGLGAEYLRGLVLPRVNPLIEPATLITPAGVFDLGSVLRLNLQDLVLTVELTERLETTRQFARFRFRPKQAH
ncbi:MAG: hypothetical protein JJT90_11495 [Ectothiorhodospiraceae bacterium]|nr:hypothetical protein [Ectothiorhodospiraceae bacterium]